MSMSIPILIFIFSLGIFVGATITILYADRKKSENKNELTNGNLQIFKRWSSVLKPYIQSLTSFPIFAILVLMTLLCCFVVLFIFLSCIF